MKLSDTLVIEAPVDRVWELLRDPRRSVPAIPGFETLEDCDDTTFSTVVAQRIGPFRARFNLQMTITESLAPQRIMATGQGTEAGGSWLKVPSAVIELEPLAGNRTRLSFDLEFTLLGKLGALGYPVFKQKAGEMSRRFSENLKRSLEQES